VALELDELERAGIEWIDAVESEFQRIVMYDNQDKIVIAELPSIDAIVLSMLKTTERDYMRD